MAGIRIDDTDALCLGSLFADYGLFFSQRHSILKQQSVVMVIFQLMVEDLSAELIAHLHP